MSNNARRIHDVVEKWVKDQDEFDRLTPRERDDEIDLLVHALAQEGFVIVADATDAMSPLWKLQGVKEAIVVLNDRWERWDAAKTPTHAACCLVDVCNAMSDATSWAADLIEGRDDDD